MELTQPRLILAGLALVLAAGCAPQPLATLPDDPTSENTPINDNDGLGTPAPGIPPVVEQPPTSGTPPAEAPSKNFVVPNYTEAEKKAILAQYDHLDPSKLVPTKLLEDAVLYFHKNKHLIKNQKVLSVIDYAKRSSLKRFFIITLDTGATWALHVSHGKGSDSNHDGYAEKFSNTPNSNATSLGAYITAETYYGNNGYSLRMDGKSSTNSNARERAIVVHGASYVQDATVIQGRSWGCPAVSNANRDKVINTIKNGSLLYAGLST